MASSSSPSDSLSSSSEHRPRERVWPAASTARMRAGLRSALKTECSGFKFQNGGRTLRWLCARETARRRYQLPSDERLLFEDDLRGLFWSAHITLLEGRWRTLGMHRVAPTLCHVFQDIGGTSRTWSRVVEDLELVERMLRWIMSRPSKLDSRGFVDGFCNGADASCGGPTRLLTIAMQHGWDWFVCQLQERCHKWKSTREQFQPQLLVAQVASGARRVTELALQQSSFCFQPALTLDAIVQRCVGRCSSDEIVAIFRGLMETPPETSMPGGRWHTLLSMLRAAAACGDLKLIKHIYRYHYDLVARREDDWLPDGLCSAARAGNLDVLHWLIADEDDNVVEGGGRGASSARRVVHGHAVSMAFASAQAVANGQVETFRFLTEMGGVTCTVAQLTDAASRCVYTSPERTLPLLEYLVDATALLTVSSAWIVHAATSHHVRADVLHWLRRHATQEQWQAAMQSPEVVDEWHAEDMLKDISADSCPTTMSHF